MLWAAVWLIFHACLRPIWSAHDRWLLLSGLILSYNLFVIWRNLPANHRHGEATLLPALGPGNALTLVRGLCIGLLAGFLFGPWPSGALAWLIVLLYTLTDVADYFDGFLARRANHVTELGGVLDMEFDGLGTLVVILLAVSFGQLPRWYLALGLARYLFVFGLWVRRRLGRPLHDMAPSVHRRVFAGLQMGFLSVVLWPILPRPMAVIAGTLFALATGLSFVRDWFVASGRLDPTNFRYRQVQQLLYRAFALALPLMWRPLLFIAMISIFRAAPLPVPAAWQSLLGEWGIPAPSLFAFLIALVGFTATPLVGLGILPRVLAVALTLPIGFDMATRGLMADNALALISIVMVQLFGPGPFALWPAEQRFMFQRLGER
ncbi:MAG: CDP-alcohol phosphatidyltransferase family protein [Anaerolineae bacterium]|uniref:CDP-alcohol phosphatidyltransferase family protein n=1 Tax=Promineifilum sp. TaxID=2664178 RepID=UPI001DBF81A4|nr:CDP-alcohol phosphatidyltransferase family protein [Anaerolineales bacterium]MCB8936513.1 CDP-alcohol phosphatidyltransferase family protein [Promineifilum sp.]MCO5182246.1 CDP-alcohol phosphatidyltransferase family protein [Promineifilum sp.]MCW5846050.1 CDP-alcohol phosphatidyltransferase family protein [Anaerolineae bacterium]